MDAVKPRSVHLLGLDFTNTSLEETSRHLLARPPGARFAYVVTPNADHLVRLGRIPRLRPVYRRAMFCLLDSQLISHCANRLGLPNPPVVTGADLTEILFARFEHLRIAVIGTDVRTIQALTARYPHITFLHHQPPMGLMHRHAAFNAARDFGAGCGAAFTFIALGSPVQELLAYAIAQQPESRGIGLCVGSALAFSAGTARRAPGWMRGRGLEWLYRLAQDPWRLAGRYLLDDPWIFAGLAMAKLRQKMR
jgi:N-acetylglucosaminyldiphosphoundecaprenol N-acetyl-beta-D-mannosaminyltransferase